MTRRKHKNLGKSIILAAKCGDTDGVIKLLNENEEKISRNDKGRAIRKAAEKGHTDIVNILLDNIEKRTCVKYKYDALCKAARNNHIDIVDILLERVGNEIPNFFKAKALNEAAKKGHVDVARLILNKSDIPSTSLGKPLMISTESGHENVVNMLLDRIGGYNHAVGGNFAFMEAAERGYSNICLSFIDHMYCPRQLSEAAESKLRETSAGQNVLAILEAIAINPVAFYEGWKKARPTSITEGQAVAVAGTWVKQVDSPKARALGKLPKQVLGNIFNDLQTGVPGIGLKPRERVDTQVGRNDALIRYAKGFAETQGISIEWPEVDTFSALIAEQRQQQVQGRVAAAV